MKHPLLPDLPLMEDGAEPSCEVLPRKIRLCVWNCHKGKHTEWTRDFLALAQQSDLFLTQEIRLTQGTVNALAQSSQHWHAAISFLSLRRKIPTGIAVGCRAPAEEIVCKSAAAEPFIKIPKMSMRMIYPMADTKLLVVNLHAINFTGLKPFKQILQNTASWLNEWLGPVIIAGDFNIWNAKRQAELYQMAEMLKLKEVSFSPDTRTRFLGKPVDCIFTRGLKVESAAVADITSSDHRPLVATLKLI